ncbi:GNAT family N-acetyltransferase [Streptomyces sp. NBC_01387]|uniref:GNAT family N-acetyltransferase n=1 Tax=unclassified Streptomyces TaxID=2593676 RepID=UPI002024DD99|nr:MULTISPECIES: GNAT family N-acetyltransferase [unclassified Streptomyces]MCX4553687.1 GNAT family N-acetyltransferase [Streptomyces sp. NBC_01500]WSC18615.1 GNAT family N-acetyltransferase [Streptomyces sp. NBC_01766]WSV52649.1 GNAT family N-acetyltransferase [Streptomyces sp. NBC_01014]
MSIEIRPYQPFDLPGMYRVCLQTGDSGRDATALYSDPDLLGHVFAGPYPVADPGLTFIAADEHGVLGYVVATADSAAHEKWLEEEWYPPLRLRYPQSMAHDPGDGTRDWQRVAQVHQPGPSAGDALYDRFPAHLHIDILPRGQGAGLGRRLITVLLEALRERGVRGLQLSVGGGNPGARAFYLAIGFTEAERQERFSVMVRDLRTAEPDRG